MSSKPVCWFKHGPYSDGEPLSVVFDDPQDTDNFSALVFEDPALHDDPNDDTTVMRYLNTGEWVLTRHVFDETMTDEWNEENAWGVHRQIAPFADALGKRHWFAPTAIEAFNKAIKDLGL